MAMSIAILAAGGGKLALSPLPGREGSYAADLADLVAFAPALVLSMTTAEETAARGAWWWAMTAPQEAVALVPIMRSRRPLSSAVSVLTPGHCRR